MTERAQHWAVVGGGLLGMTLAYRLAQAGQRVTLFEQGDRLGGLASPWEVGGVTWDRHYHVTLNSDLQLRQLLGELGLEEQLCWEETKTGFYVDGQHYSMSNTLEFLRFPPLNLIEKLRLGATIFFASKRRRWRPLERICVEDWLVRWSGRRTFEKIWRPLLRAKLGDNYRDTSAAFIWATIARMYAARRSGLKKEMFGYVPGGYDAILSRFSDALARAGVEICLNRPIECISTDADGTCQIAGPSGDVSCYDGAVLTVPAPIASRLLPGLTQVEHDLYNGVRYQGIVCASALLKQPLSPYYVTNITDSRAPFTAVIEMSTLVDRKAFGGGSLVYLPKYVDARDDAAFAVSDEQYQEEFVGALERMYPDFRPDWVEAFRVSRVRQVMPIPTLNYSDRLPPQRTSLPGVYTVNSAHIVNGTLNVNQTVRLAEEAYARWLAPDGEADGATIGAQQKAAKPLASLSLDLDNKWSYQKTHGDPGWQSFPSYLDVVCPRFCAVLASLNLRITVFVVGQDAVLEKNRAAIGAVAAAGHEIGNHSFHHEPWLHRYTDAELNEEIGSAEEAIEGATGYQPVGFRGPGFSHSPAMFRTLSTRGYEYDASTFPTILGPAARAYYFMTARLNRQQKEERKQLFGRFRDGFQRLEPHLLDVGARPLLEIPVTTMPLFRTPIHVSYLLYLWQFSHGLALRYFQFAMALCRVRGVSPSLLLHPLDFLGADDDGDLSFFPAMSAPGAEKTEFVGEVLRLYSEQFEVVTMREHCQAVRGKEADPLGATRVLPCAATQHTGAPVE